MTPRVGVITQARTTSSRLPRKVLIDIAGQTVFEHHLARLAAHGLPVYVATTINRVDDPIEDLARARGLDVHRGSETDVLRRFHDCALVHDLDVVARVTSDCPLIDGAIVRQAIDKFLKAGSPTVYVSNTLRRTFPRGFDVEVFSVDALRLAHENASDPSDREHVTPYIRNAGERGEISLQNITWIEDKSSYRVTLDTEKDLELLVELLEGHMAHQRDCAEIIRILDDHPELVQLNRDVHQRESWSAS